MLLIVGFALACLFSLYFYCKALTNGLGRKRWAFAGFVFGPLVIPAFNMSKRMKCNKLFGLDFLIFKA